jgi:hypothetical protein
MPEAFNSLHQAPEPFQPVSRSAVCILARLAAKRAVEAELKAKGVRVALIRPAEIKDRASVYLDAHPELYREAHERAS